jgi:glutamate decarboxylase
MEITESLMEKQSSAHALTSHVKHEQKEGKLDDGSGSEPSGTYAKPC